MSIPVYVADAFTNKPFAGNPAAVCILEKPLSEPTMKLIAREMNLSETAYVYPIDAVSHRYSLRWFTPEVEVNLCGHATLATAYVMLTQTELANNIPDVLRFDTLSGELQVGCVDKTASPLVLQMNFPLGNPQPLELTVEIKQQISSCFGLDTSVLPIDVHYCSLTKKLLINYDHMSTVNSTKPSKKLLEIAFPVEVRGVIVTSGDTGAAEYAKYDFVSRYFAPWVGIDEDPVCGSAHTVLGAYWRVKTGKDSLLAYQLSPNRGGEVQVQVDDVAKRIWLRGTATVILKGAFTIPLE